MHRGESTHSLDMETEKSSFLKTSMGERNRQERSFLQDPSGVEGCLVPVCHGIARRRHHREERETNAGGAAAGAGAGPGLAPAAKCVYRCC